MRLAIAIVGGLGVEGVGAPEERRRPWAGLRAGFHLIANAPCPGRGFQTTTASATAHTAPREPPGYATQIDVQDNEDAGRQPRAGLAHLASQA